MLPKEPGPSWVCSEPAVVPCVVMVQQEVSVGLSNCSGLFHLNSGDISYVGKQGISWRDRGPGESPAPGRVLAFSAEPHPVALLDPGARSPPGRGGEFTCPQTREELQWM